MNSSFEPPPLRIVRIIARLNIGGPAIQAITLTKLLRERGYETRLVRGSEGVAEGNMDYLAAELGVQPTRIEALRRDPSPEKDVRALGSLIRILRADRPHVVHTHAAKAGTLGRLAVVLAFPKRSARPSLVHTFHGHSLTGYFGGCTSAVYGAIERWLAHRTDALLAVSDEVRDDLVRLGIASPDRFTVVPLGFDLAPFLDDSDREARRSALRQELGIPDDAELVTLVARLVPIKRVDRFLRVARLVAEARPLARFLVVGDGELRDQLRASAEARALRDRVIWAGFRRDMPSVCFASDVVVLTSDNEGTPVSLIEAQAASVPVVGTDVGGMRAAVIDGQTGILEPTEDEPALAAAVERLLGAPDYAAALARAGREHVLGSFGIRRLIDDLDLLYRALLER
jgi:glycosyltransferase involved in cell wall biosynthesis